MDKLIHRIKCLWGMVDSKDPKSQTFKKIKRLEERVKKRGGQVPGRNDCYGASASGQRGRDDY